MVNKILLSISGGGVRLFPALVLHELYRRTGKQPSDIFDMFIGTSTGAIMSLLYNSPNDYTTEDVVNFYLGEEVKKIFKGKLIKLPWDTAKYPAKDIESVLQNRMGEATLKDCKRPCVITTNDTNTRQIIFMNSIEDRYKDIKMWQAARASSAAPIYFPVFKLGDMSLIDGGVSCNDPSSCGLDEINKLFDLDDITVISLGTGSSATSIPYDKISKWNIIDWAANIYGFCSDGQSDIAQYHIKRVLPEDKVITFNFILPSGLDSMDDASDKNLNNLVCLFKELIAGDWRDNMNQLVSLVG